MELLRQRHKQLTPSMSLVQVLFWQFKVKRNLYVRGQGVVVKAVALAFCETGLGRLHTALDLPYQEIFSQSSTEKYE